LRQVQVPHTEREALTRGLEIIGAPSFSFSGAASSGSRPAETGPSSDIPLVPSGSSPAETGIGVSKKSIKRQLKKSKQGSAQELEETRKKQRKAFKSFAKQSSKSQYRCKHLENCTLFDGPMVPVGNIDFCDSDENTRYEQTNAYNFRFHKDTGFLEAQMQWEWKKDGYSYLDVPNGLKLGEEIVKEATFESVERDILADLNMVAADIIANPLQENPVPNPETDDEKTEHLNKVNQIRSNISHIVDRIKKSGGLMQTIRKAQVIDDTTVEAYFDVSARMIQKFCTAGQWKELAEKRGILEAYRMIPRADQIFWLGEDPKCQDISTDSVSASSGGPPAETAVKMKAIANHVHTVHGGFIDSLDRPLDTSEIVTIESIHQQSKEETDINDVNGIDPTLTDPLQEAKIKSVIDGCKLCSKGIQK
jgi:hypothetical protein